MIKELICLFLGHKWDLVLSYQQGFNSTYLLANGKCTRCGLQKGGLYSDFRGTGTITLNADDNDK